MTLCCFRSESYPEESRSDGSEPDGGLGSGRVHGVRIAAAGGDAHQAVGSGRRARDLQVNGSTSTACKWRRSRSAD